MRYASFFAFLLLAGCDSCDKKQDANADAGVTVTVTDASTASASASASASATPDAGAPKHDMGNCPTAVAGASVLIEDVEGGVAVSVTGKDDAAVKEIRDRATKLAAADRGAADGGPKHDHSGSGGGTTGRCTIIMRNTDLAVAEIPKGSKITVKAKTKTEVDWVRRETKDRDKETRETGSAGAGAQRMGHCPSAVEGAKTTVKDAKDGVVVTVTGPKDKVDEIRARAKHTADVAKKADATKVEHTGEGTGGGTVARCPIVVQGDTTVDVKEVEGGVEVTVSTKKDVAALQKESKARAENFASK